MKFYRKNELEHFDGDILIQKLPGHNEKQALIMAMEHKEHTHDFYEFVLICEGTGIHYIDDIRYNIGAGNILFVDIGQKHSFVHSSDVVFYNFLISNDFMKSFNAVISEKFMVNNFVSLTSDGFKEQCAFFEDTEYEHLLNLLKYIKFATERKNVEELTPLLYVFITAFTKHVTNHSGLNNIEKYQANSHLKEKIFDYIEAHCCEESFSLSMIANSFGYSTSYFSRLFHNLTGEIFWKYTQFKRLEKAKNMLECTDFNIDEIIYMCGYSNKKRFYELFKGIYGETPMAIRKRK